MKYTVITTFNQAGLELYGQRMIDTFEAHWPAEVDLIVCTENCQPKTQRPNTYIVDLVGASEDLRNFVERHKNNPKAHGKDGPELYHPKKQFRWDAVRFCYKVFTVALCANRRSDGWMIWLDADTHTHKNVPIEFFNKVCPVDSMISYLGRGNKYHSECGWVGYNLDHPATKNFIDEFVRMYNSDSIFNLKEWHDSYVWDVIRKRFEGNNKFTNLNPIPDNKGLAGHPFINSELGRYMDHVKGARKQTGHSKSDEAIMHLDSEYWRTVRKMK